MIPLIMILDILSVIIIILFLFGNGFDALKEVNYDGIDYVCLLVIMLILSLLVSELIFIQYNPIIVLSIWLIFVEITVIYRFVSKIYNSHKLDKIDRKLNEISELIGNLNLSKNEYTKLVQKEE